MSSPEDGAAPPSRRGWLAWPLLVVSALPLVGAVLVARRVLTGATGLFGEVPVEPPFRERAGLLLQAVGAEQQVLVPVLGLAALAWLARRESAHRPPVAALWAGAVVALVAALLALAQCALLGYLILADAPPGEEAGFFSGRSALLEIFGPRTASALVVAVLALALAAGLAAAARRGAPAGEGELIDEADPSLEPDPALEADGALEPDPSLEPDPTLAPEPDGSTPGAADDATGEGAPRPGQDPHARFRRPP